MKKFKSIILLIFISNYILATEVKICIDEAPWKPFVYMNKDKAMGAHIDLVRDICKKLRVKCSFYPMPWKRCLGELEDGRQDAVVSASFSKERSSYLLYPKESEREMKYLSNVSYQVISLKKSRFNFDGDLTKLPKPIRSMDGYSITNKLIKKGIEVVPYGSVEKMFMSLLESKRGVVISVLDNVMDLKLKNHNKRNLYVNDRPIQTKNYFMPFSKKTDLGVELINKFWKEMELLNKLKGYKLRAIKRHRLKKEP